MIHFTDATGLLGSALAIAAASTRIPGMLRLASAYWRWLPAAVFVAVLLPVGTLPLAAYLRGVIGDLSITSLILLAASLLHAWRGGAAPSDRGKFLLLIGCTAAVFYPLALGWGGFDPYRLGFGSYGFLACLLAVGVAAAPGRSPLATFAIALSVLAWSAGWYASTNLWDYLLDPLVSIYAAFALAARAVRKFTGGALQRP